MANNVKKIFLMLGPKCNLQCKYCLQHEMIDKDKTKVDRRVIKWLQEQIHDFDRTLNIVFYGGEPLVYWDAIKEVAETVRGNVRYGIISNGKLMTEDKVEFINDYDIGVTISWDGANVQKTRGYDVVKSNPCILDIKRLSFSAVLSTYTYPLDFLDEAEPIFQEYRRMHGHRPGINIDTIMDFGNCGELRKMDCNKIAKQMDYIIAHRKEKSTYFQITKNLMDRYVFYRKYVDTRPACGNGYTVWNVDINGDLYRCHNCGDKIGTIFDEDKEIFSNAEKLNPIPKYYREKCSKCPVQPLCRSGCPLIDEKGREEYYCDIKKAYLGPIIKDMDTPKEVGRVIHIG